MFEYMDPSDGDLLNYVALENEAVMTAFYASRNTYQLVSPLVEPPPRPRYQAPTYETHETKKAGLRMVRPPYRRRRPKQRVLPSYKTSRRKRLPIIQWIPLDEVWTYMGHLAPVDRVCHLVVIHKDSLGITLLRDIDYGWETVWERVPCLDG
jgi:hypothetical protein